MYKIPDRITDMLALCGLYWVACEVWRGLEMFLHGASQESIVDGVVAVIGCALIVVALRVWSIFEHEGM